MGCAGLYKQPEAERLVLTKAKTIICSLAQATGRYPDLCAAPSDASHGEAVTREP